VEGAEAALVDTAGAAIFGCAALDPAGISGSGSVVYDGAQVTADPRFCAPALCSSAPTTDGDYSVADLSPCLASASPCDSLIGARGEGCTVTGVPEEEGGPVARALTIGPGPVRGSLRVGYALPSAGSAALEIFDVTGARVRGFQVEGGQGTLVWDGRDGAGRRAPTGVYFVRLQGPGGSVMGRGVLVN
jgi:hypothetical protein